MPSPFDKQLGIIGPLPPDSGMTEEEAYRLYDELEAAKKNPGRDSYTLGAPKDNQQAAADIVRFGGTPADFRRKGFGDIADIIAMIPTEYDSLVADQNYDASRKQDQEYWMKNHPNQIPYPVGNDIVPEANIGLENTAEDNTIKPWNPGDQLRARKMLIPTAPVPNMMQRTPEGRAMPPEHTPETERASAMTMLEEYLKAQDLQRISDIKRRLVNQAVTPTEIKLPKFNPDSGVRG